MAKVYAELIRKGLKTIGDVPRALQAEVKKLLENEQFFSFPRKNFLPEGGAHNGGCLRDADRERQKDAGGRPDAAQRAGAGNPRHP